MSDAPDPRFPVGTELPEVNWLYRRLYSFGLTFAAAALVGFVAARLTDVGALRAIALGALGVIVLTQLLYVGGATLYEIWQLVSAVRTKRTVTETRSAP